MPRLPRPHSESIKEDLQSGPAFRRAFLAEAINSMVEGYVETAKIALCHFIDGTLGFEALGGALGRSPITLRSTLRHRGNPSARCLFQIVAHLQSLEGSTLRLEAVKTKKRKAA